jgi:hypothetical protein
VSNINVVLEALRGRSLPPPMKLPTMLSLPLEPLHALFCSALPRRAGVCSAVVVLVPAPAPAAAALTVGGGLDWAQGASETVPLDTLRNNCKPNAVRERNVVRIYVSCVGHGKALQSHSTATQKKTKRNKRNKSRVPLNLRGNCGAAATQMAAATHCQQESGTCRSF